MQLKVMAGSLKNRRLRNIPAAKGHLKFTPGIIKKALFDTLAHKVPDPENYSFIDLFAGSGQMGVEALSRGFSSVWFADKDAARIDAIRSSLEYWDIDPQHYRLTISDFEKVLRKNINQPNTIIFCDPPYGQSRKNLLLPLYIMQRFISGRLVNGSYFFGQMALSDYEAMMQKAPDIITGIQLVERKYGSHVLFEIEGDKRVR